MKNKIVMIATFLMMLGLSACSHVSPPTHSVTSNKQAGKWALLPFKNLSETPKAGERAESLANTVLFSKGLSLQHYPAQDSDDLVLMLDDNKRLEAAKKWAAQQGYRYALTGDVTEWRYKTGLDADPSIGLTVRVIDLKHDTVIYNQSGSKVGWGYTNLSDTAQTLLQKLLAGIS